MNKILILGAGRSATALINYLLDEASKNGWYVTVADSNLKAAQKKWETILVDEPSGSM